MGTRVPESTQRPGRGPEGGSGGRARAPRGRGYGCRRSRYCGRGFSLTNFWMYQHVTWALRSSSTTKSRAAWQPGREKRGQGPQRHLGSEAQPLRPRALPRVCGGAKGAATTAVTVGKPGQEALVNCRRNKAGKRGARIGSAPGEARPPVSTASRGAHQTPPLILHWMLLQEPPLWAGSGRPGLPPPLAEVTQFSQGSQEQQPGAGVSACSCRPGGSGDLPAPVPCTHWCTMNAC